MPEDFEANALAGENYYNQGIDLYLASQDVKDDKKEAKMLADAKEFWKKALPYLEKAHKLKADDDDVKKLLIEVYFKTGDEKKASELKKEQ